MESNSVCGSSVACSGSMICLIEQVLLQTELDDTKFCYQLIIPLTKFVIYKALFLI